MLRGGAVGVGAGGAQSTVEAAAVGKAQAAQQGQYDSAGFGAGAGAVGTQGAGGNIVNGSGSSSVAEVGQASSAILLDDASMAASQVGARLRQQRRQQRRRRLLTERVADSWRETLRQTWRRATGSRQAWPKTEYCGVAHCHSVLILVSQCILVCFSTAVTSARPQLSPSQKLVVLAMRRTCSRASWKGTRANTACLPAWCLATITAGDLSIPGA